MVNARSQNDGGINLKASVGLKFPVLCLNARREIGFALDNGLFDLWREKAELRACRSIPSCRRPENYGPRFLRLRDFRSLPAGFSPGAGSCPSPLIRLYSALT